MDTDSLLEHRHLKFRQLGGFEERASVDSGMKRNMKKKDLPVSEITANLEVELEKLKEALDSKKSSSPLLSDEAIEKLKQEVDKETTNAFIAMGMQEKLKSLKMDLFKLPSDQNPTPVLQERADRLVQEFKNNLSIPGSFDGLKEKLKMLSDIRTRHESTTKREIFNKEINEKLQDRAKEKTVLLRRARKMVAKGEELDDEAVEVAEKAKRDLIEILNSANLEVVGTSRKLARSAPPALVDMVVKANEAILEEIDKIVDKIRLRSKLAELRTEIGKGPGKDKGKVVSLIKEIKEGILTSLDAADLERKVKSMVSLQAVPEAVGAVM